MSRLRKGHSLDKEDLASSETLARHAPKAWRSDTALARAGFARVRGGLREAMSASRAARLGRRMAALRKKAGLTQAQVARRMGTTASAVSRMESVDPGNLTLESLDRYARAVGAELRLSLVATKSG